MADETQTCPWDDCGAPLTGLGRFCHVCERYTDDHSRKLAAIDNEEARRAAMPKDDRLEEEIRMEIRGQLEIRGWCVVDFEQGYRPDGGTRVRRGVADLYVMGFGCSAWMEVKSATGTQTEEQKSFEFDCRDSGIPYVLVRHEDAAVAAMEEIRWRRDNPE